MGRSGLRGALAVALVALGGVAAACGEEEETASARAAEQQQGPIRIGAAIDRTKSMAPFDGPALAAAQIRAEQLNQQGGASGRRLEFEVRDTQLDPERTRSSAIDLVSRGVDLLWVSCDVDVSMPSIQVGLSRRLLTVAPCIGTDQMGPKRFGEAGNLAYSFGNVAQDEGAALAQLARDKGFDTANVVTDKALVYTQNVCQAFTNRFTELGGRVEEQESFTEGDETVGNVVRRVNRSEADTIVMCATTQNDLPAFVSGVRSAGNDTTIMGPWSIDGAGWLPKSDRVADNILLTTYASVYGDDPDPRVRELIAKLKQRDAEPVTGGFVAGAAAVDGIAAAVQRTDGSTQGARLASTMGGFRDLVTVSGQVSFSDEFHTAFGRQYRVIEIQNGKPRFTGLVEARTPAEL
ncbi:MAG: ABC transporter substrate-binding protein [Solirubrobacterales bacterium]|nr:ABC transporter substrate-binding protein [Solirubrobacterales bacterium]